MPQDTQTTRFEDFVRIGEAEYCVTLRDDGQGGYWFKVDQYDPSSQYVPWRHCLGPVHIPDASNVLDALRGGFREPRTKMKNWIRSWRNYAEWAAAEPPGNQKGSKRSYYTKHAHEALKIALEYAPQWKLCKALYKQITRLERV